MAGAAIARLLRAALRCCPAAADSLRFIGCSRRCCDLCGDRRGILDHLLGGASGAGDQRLNHRSLRQVPPVFLRHLRLHGLHLQPRRIEDAGVIAAARFPPAGPPTARRDLPTPGVNDSFVSVPMRADVRRQDRPGHVGEAPHEKRRGQLRQYDAPARTRRRSAMSALAADFAEADESMHLVLVAAHGLCHPATLRDIAVGRDLHQVVIARAAATAGDRATRSARGSRCRIADFAKLDEFARDIESAAAARSTARMRIASNKSASTAFAPSTSHRLARCRSSASARAALRQPSKVRFVCRARCECIATNPNPSCAAVRLEAFAQMRRCRARSSAGAVIG